MNKFIQITQVRSSIGCLPKHRLTLRSLGLKHINQIVIHKDTPSIRGMIKLIYYMITVKGIYK